MVELVAGAGNDWTDALSSRERFARSSTRVQPVARVTRGDPVRPTTQTHSRRSPPSARSSPSATRTRESLLPPRPAGPAAAAGSAAGLHSPLSFAESTFVVLGAWVAANACVATTTGDQATRCFTVTVADAVVGTRCISTRSPRLGRRTRGARRGPIRGRRQRQEHDTQPASHDSRLPGWRRGARSATSSGSARWRPPECSQSRGTWYLLDESMTVVSQTLTTTTAFRIVRTRALPGKATALSR